METRRDEGSILILAMCMTFFVALLMFSFWVLVRTNYGMFAQKRGEIRAYYVAMAGINEAIDEIAQNNPWQIGQVDNEWVQDAGDTFYKSSYLGPNSLPYFEYPAKMTVTLESEQGYDGLIEINSLGEVKESLLDPDTFSRFITVYAIRTIAGDVVVLDRVE